MLNILICSKRKLIPRLSTHITSHILQRIEKELFSLIKNQKIQVDHIESLCYTTKWMFILYNGIDFVSFFPFSIFFAPFSFPKSNVKRLSLFRWICKCSDIFTRKIIHITEIGSVLLAVWVNKSNVTRKQINVIYRSLWIAPLKNRYRKHSIYYLTNRFVEQECTFCENETVIYKPHTNEPGNYAIISFAHFFPPCSSLHSIFPN